MMTDTPDLQQIYKEYINDVTARNTQAIEFKNKRQSYWEEKTLSYVEARFIELTKNEKKYRQQHFNLDDETRNIKRSIIQRHFADTPAVKAAVDIFQSMCENLRGRKKEGMDDEQYHTLRTLAEQAFWQKIDRFYPVFEPQIKLQDLLKISYTQAVVQMETENRLRKTITREMGDTQFDGTKDGGNCTKGIIASLYKMQKKYEIELFDKSIDAEDLVHPVTLIKQLTPYLKKSESGLLKDIPDIKTGDIIFLTKENGDPGHAMMCYDKDENDAPLLLGFSPTQNNIKAFASKSDKLRRGYIVDVKSLISDKISSKNRHKITQIQPQLPNR